MKPIYLVMEEIGQYEDYCTTPLKAFKDIKDAKDCIEELKKYKSKLSRDAFEDLYDEVLKREDVLFKTKKDFYGFSSIIEGIKFFHPELTNEEIEDAYRLYHIYAEDEPNYYIKEIGLY